MELLAQKERGQLYTHVAIAKEKKRRDKMEELDEKKREIIDIKFFGKLQLIKGVFSLSKAKQFWEEI